MALRKNIDIRPRSADDGDGPVYQPSRGGWYPKERPATGSSEPKRWQCSGPCRGTFPAPAPDDRQVCTACRALGY